VKKIIACTLALLMLLCTASCAKSPSNSSPTPTNTPENAIPVAAKDEIHIAIDSDPGDLSPWGANPQDYYKDQIYDTLFHMGYDGEYVPILATRWETIDDLHYKIYMRDDIIDSAGNKINANDVLFSIGMAKAGVNYSGQIAEIDLNNCQAIDDYTLLISMSEPNSFAFYGGLAMLRIVSKASYEASTDGMVTKPIGSGAYVLKDWVPGTSITMERNEKYWGEAPAIKTVYLEVISEASQRTTALEMGEIDLIMNVQNSDYKYLDSLDNVTVYNKSTVACYGVWFNMTEHSVMNNKDFRYAIAYAIDNEAIAKVAMGGFGVPAVSACSTAMKDYDTSMNSEVYSAQNLEKAKEYMKASGVPEGTTITLITNGGDEEIAIMSAIQSMLMNLGLNIKITSYEAAVYGTMEADAASGWDLAIESFVCPSGYVLDEWYKYMGFLNYSKWSGEKWEEFVAYGKSAIQTSDDDTRQEMTNKFIDMLQEEMPLYLVAQKTINFAYNSSLNYRVWDIQSVRAADLKFS